MLVVGDRLLIVIPKPAIGEQFSFNHLIMQIAAQLASDLWR